MWASLVTLLLLGCFLLWIRAWQRRSRLAIGLAIGAALVVGGFLLLPRTPVFDHVPAWAPALPFATVAITLFGFGALAWFWGED